MYTFEAEVEPADLRSLRFYKGAVGSVSEQRPLSRAYPEAKDVPGRTIFAGPWFSHFGHFIAEGVHRLWPALLPGMGDAKVLFQTGSRAPRVHEWTWDILDLFGIVPERVLFTTEARRYERLIVAPQGRLLNGPVLTRNYLDVFPLIQRDTPSGSGAPIYLSRSRQIATGTYFGEPLIESVLTGAGYEIVYPELLSIRDLLPKLIEAPVIIAAEGSALHNLELCGRLTASVYVIGRRHGFNNFVHLLKAATSDWGIFDPGKRPAVFNMDHDPATGRSLPSHGCTLLDLSKLIAEMASFTGEKLRVPPSAVIKDAIQLDIARYILQADSPMHGSDEQLGASIREMRRLAAAGELLSS